MYKVRVPVGKRILELPAGMLENDKGDFIGTAAREVSLSMSISVEILIFPAIYKSACILTLILYRSWNHGLFLLPLFFWGN